MKLRSFGSVLEEIKPLEMKLVDYLKIHTSDRGIASLAECPTFNFLERIVVSTSRK